VTKGAELHHISLTSRTPLLELLPPFLCCLQEREYLSIPQFDHWLQDLAECGVDLEEYGRTETYLHEREHVDWTIEGDFTIQDGSEVEILWTMKELYYGQSPRNWGFYMEADIYTSDEGLEHDMPGAWIDEESMSQEGQRGIEDDDLARRAEDEEDESADIIEDGRNSEQSSDEGESVDGEFDSNGVWEENQNPGVKDLHDEKNIVRTEIIDKSPVGLSPGAGEYIYVFPCDPLDLTKYKKIIIRH